MGVHVYTTCCSQLYVEKAKLDASQGEGSFELVKSAVDVGDIVGVTGGVKRTEKGELSVMATSMQVRHSVFLHVRVCTSQSCIYATGVTPVVLVNTPAHACH